MRIGWFTPYNPCSGIGDYSEVILRALAGTVTVEVFAADAAGVSESRPCALPLTCLKGKAGVPDLGRFDLLVYNLGSYAPYHARIFDAAQARPGLAILHDLVMRDFFNGYYADGRYAPGSLERCRAFCHGAETLAEQRHLNRIPTAVARSADLFRYTMAPAVAHRALGIVVHSEFTRRRVAAAADVPVRKIDFPIFGPAQQCVDLAPARRNDDGQVRLLTFGVLNPNKLVHAVIAAIGNDPHLRRHAVYTVLGTGEAPYVAWLKVLIEQFGLEDQVRLLGYRDDDELRQEMAVSDIIVNLRNPHLGESSAVLLNSLVAGLPTVVWDHGFYGEFPDDVVCKVQSEEELAVALARLCRDPAGRQRLGQRARAHALERFDVATYVRRFLEFAEELRGRQPLQHLYDRVTEVMVEMGVCHDDGLADRLADEIALFGLGQIAAPMKRRTSPRPQSRAA